MAVASLAVLTGAAGSIEAMPDLDALGARLVFGAISASSAKFDPSDLDRLNADLVHAMPYEAVAERLRTAGVPDGLAPAFWRAVRDNCVKVDEAGGWWRMIEGGPQAPPSFEADERDYLVSAFALLPPEPWDGATWKAWTDAVKAASGRKGKALFLPLRRALTGLDHGPELALLLPLIGRARALERAPT